jgi:7,8-dihydropterin-6-yl-methyl-4-(beta-D-ribofuranosyl)aminobenzene 5'-phosphate synthase
MKLNGSRFAVASGGLSILAVGILLALTVSAINQKPRRITILYDAFGGSSKLKKDWGFAALVEYDDKRILFDTGNDVSTFEHNVKELGVDLTRLDAVVISHRHGDHTSGLGYLLRVNPNVKIYVPQEAGFFKSSIPPAFMKPHPSLPMELRYYEGKPPEQVLTGAPWENAQFEIITKTTEIFPSLVLFTTRSEKQGTLEMNELSLAIRTPDGLAVVVGCSHSGVEKILREATEIEPRLYTVTGGFHLVMAPEVEVRRTVDALHDTLKVERVAPGHCTSELGFALFLDRYKERFDRAGLGAIVELP